MKNSDMWVLFLYLTPICASVVVINTWSGPFEDATRAAYDALSSGKSVIDAVEIGCSVCEEKQCDTSVGFGNHPDTSAHTSLDALIMDGTSMDVGCVGYVKKYRSAISIARYVMQYTDETMLVGDGAEDFAHMMGFSERSATTSNSIAVYNQWVNASCQPNFYDNIPEAEVGCGPYPPQPHPSSLHVSNNLSGKSKEWASRENHDTIGMVTLSLTDDSTNMACGTSTNGASHKIAGRIGDSPIPGSGCYVKSSVGGAAATGDGDVMMRFAPSFAAVMFMEQGKSPEDACKMALQPIASAFPSFSGGMVCLNSAGEYGGAKYNMDFSYSVRTDQMKDVQVVNV